MNSPLASHLCLHLSKHNIMLVYCAHSKVSITERMDSMVRSMLSRSGSYGEVGMNNPNSTDQNYIKHNRKHFCVCHRLGTKNIKTLGLS